MSDTNQQPIKNKMNRVIKFRGQCAISKEMVFGDLIHGVSSKDGQLFILPNKHNLAYVKHCDPMDGVRVIPETVGQFTGRKDKNGVDIYEGDIVIHNDYTKGAVLGGEQFKTKGKVLITDMFNGIKLPGLGFSIDQRQFDAMEIIGNIHENPELL